MVKTVTLTFRSANYEGVEAKETFTFEQLRIEDGMSVEEASKKVMDEIFLAWVCDKLNLAYSVVVEETDE